jgi:hypothetical protein
MAFSMMAFSIMPFSIMILSILDLVLTLRIRGPQIITTLGISIKCYYAECHIVFLLCRMSLRPNGVP